MSECVCAKYNIFIMHVAAFMCVVSVYICFTVCVCTSECVC